MEHPERMTVAEEILACIQLRKDTPEKLLPLMDKYGKYPVYATGVMYRSAEMGQLCKDWYLMQSKTTFRDQITFAAFAEKYGIKITTFPFLQNFKKHKHAALANHK
jgi:hypothetical protein